MGEMEEQAPALTRETLPEPGTMLVWSPPHYEAPFVVEYLGDPRRTREPPGPWNVKCAGLGFSSPRRIPLAQLRLASAHDLLTIGGEP